MKLSRLLIVVFFVFSTGCAVGPTIVKVNHEPINKVSNKKEGKILIKTFIDKREDGHKEHIGNKRNTYGMVLGWIDSNDKIENVLTKYFAEALREAGYEVSITTVLPENISDYDALIEGNILDFWLDLYMMVWHSVLIEIKIVDNISLKPVWQKEFKGDESNVLWLGIISEYEQVISEALTEALNKAVDEFSSEEFYKIIIERRNSVK